MEGRFNDEELLFIQETLDQHGEYVTDLFTQQIEEKGLIKNQELLDSIHYRTTKSGNNPVLQFNFMGYGRAIEIRWHKKSQNTQRFAKPNTNALIWGMRENKKRTPKKDTRWYAKTVYGSINRLIGILMYEFTDEERRRLKNILERQRNEPKS